MSQAGAINVTEDNPEIPIDFVTNSGTAIAIANVIEILGGSGVTTSAIGNTITITVSSSGFTWNSVTSANNIVQILAENAYSCQGVSLVVFLLPLAPIFGDTFIIASTNSRFQITANGSQQMLIGAQISTAGSGTVTSNSRGDYLEIVYMGNNIFQSFSPQGTITIT